MNIPITRKIWAFDKIYNIEKFDMGNLVKLDLFLL